LDRGEHSSDDRNEHRARHATTAMMVFEQLFRADTRSAETVAAADTLCYD